MTEKEFLAVFPNAFEKAKKFIFSRYQIDYASCEDILQNASVKAFKNFPSFEGRSSFDSWFISILINEVRSFFLFQKKSKIIDDSEIDFSQYSFVYEEPEINKKEKEEENLYFLNYTLSKLSKKHKTVIDLLLKEKTTFEISKKLKIPISSVRTRAYYARKKIKEMISSYALDTKS